MMEPNVMNDILDSVERIFPLLVAAYALSRLSRQPKPEDARVKRILGRLDSVLKGE